MSEDTTRVLVFGYLPPPYFGPSTAYQGLLRSEFVHRLKVSFIDLTVETDLRKLETFRFAKLFSLVRVVLLELFYLLGHRFDFVCYPVSFNRNAFLKDALLLSVARMFRVPIVLWAHGNNLPRFRDRSPRWMQWIIDHTLRHAAAAIVLGDQLRFNFERHLPPDLVLVVPLGIEPPVSLPPRRSHDRFTVLYLGNLVREKGVFDLLAVARRCPELRFVFAGTWRRDDEAAEAVRIAGSNVEFIGRVVGDAKWQALAGADILAFPTYYEYETFGLVLLEAMCSGLPVVATRRAAIPEIVRDGTNGLLVNEQDVSDLAESILRLAADSTLRERMGRANRQRFLELFTAEQYGRRMCEVFEQLAARHSSERSREPQRAP